MRWMNRRGFMKTTALAGAAIGLSSPYVRAQSAATINMMGWSSPKLRAVLARAGKEVGVSINYDVMPSKWDDVMAKITLWGQSGYSGIDLLMADDLISGLWGMNGWAEDLSGTDAWTKNSSDVVNNIIALNNAVGGVYRIFFYMGFESFFFNKSMVAKAPTTWEEMVSAAKDVTKEGIWGWRPLGGGGHAFNTVLQTLNQAGADLATLNDPATLVALQFMYDWVQKDKITPPSTISEDESAVVSLAAAGKAAMWWDYEEGYNTIRSIGNTVVTKENLGVARWPKGPSSDIGLVHGWGFLLSKFSQKKDAAKELLSWLSSKDIIREMDIAVSVPPPYKSMFEEPGLQKALPILTAGPGWSELIRGAKFREPIVNSPAVAQLWSMFEHLGGYILSGEKSPEDAQAWAVEEYKSIRG
ncbi:extracellular solute-binding protein [Sinorhizobium meliloti]|uniref:extracellular solute-binding protein n=1 Tax=Rhizobium meliloti TaxID=382 RepID=UPI00129727C3|nr:extracellular solute-binding protein [Sinorhizobium meliloti]